ncbi:MAG: flagellar biosynthesis protein FliQ [Alphaproteobacteria bacterium]
MDSVETLEIVRGALWVTLKVCAPVMIFALVTGLVISFFQAITQIQEMTLTFVPKILVVFLSLVMFGSYMLSSLTSFTMELADKIVSGGGF